MYITGDGTTKKAKELLREQSAKYAGKIGPAILNPVTAFYAFQMYLSPKLGYPLPVSSFLFKECSHIQAPALMVTLPKLKINRNSSRAIVHGPNRYGGLQLKHLYCEQGHGQLRLFLGHLRNRDHTGDLIKVAMSYMQILVGSTIVFLNLPYPKYAKWIERSWLKSMWEILSRANFSVDVRLAWVPQMQRTGDSALMSIFLESGYGPYELTQLNRCRLYHQVFFISDVASANVKQTEDIYRTKERNLSRVSSWQWPTQGEPDRPAWLLWERALTYLENHGKLRVPVGAWLTKSHQAWEWQMHISTQIVARRTDGQNSYFRPLITGGTRSRTQIYSMDSRATWCDSLEDEDNGRWAAVTICYSDAGGELFTIQQSGAFHTLEKISAIEPEYDTTFQEKVSRVDPFFYRLIGPLQTLTEGTMEAIQTYIQDGTLLTCSDGSFEPETGMASHAWVFSDKQGHLLWGGAGPIDGNPEMGSSYRSELGGALTVLFLLQQIVEYFEITSGSVMFYCDNQGALDNIFD